MFPEKPKNSLKPRQINRRGFFITLMVLPLLITILLNQHVPTAQFVDMLLIGVMLCCTLHLIYQGLLWLLVTLFQDADDGIDQS
jgi:hypothetical protein